jgi:ABC-type bacteriocin/lantibiotic exporter with double-glycine peptidase domain
MTLIKLLKFFIKEINFKTWLNVLINFVIQFSVIISEILFLSTFFLLLNQKKDTNLFSIFFDKIEYYFTPYFKEHSLTEIYIGLLIFFLITKNILTLFQNVFLNNFIFSVSSQKSAKILESYLSKSYENFSKKEISIYLKQLVRDVENVFVGIFGLIINFIGEFIYALVLIFFVNSLVGFNPSYEIFILIVIIILILSILYLGAKKFGELRAINETKVFKTLSDTLNIFKEIKLVEQTNIFTSRYHKFLSQYYKTRVIGGLISLSPKFMFEVFLLLLFYIMFRNENGEMNITDFIIKYSVLAIALMRLIPTFSKLSAYFSNIIFNIESVKFIEKDLVNKISLKKKFIKKNKISHVQLKDINISYINNPKFVKLNLEFKKNNIYGVYGKSGSGKTTLLNLLSGFIRPQKGEIIIDNINYNFYSITNKIKVGYAAQMPTIIDENIHVNIALDYLNNQRTENKIKEYLKKFDLNKFNKKKYFINSISSSIKDMSGGEKQRIGFIRAIINDANLILLDEPTSSLDSKNEKKIFQFLGNIKKNKIIVVTSHKKNQKKYFDKIINL